MQMEFITQNLEETKKLGKILAGELCGGEVICLSGELGAGKTTFTQGFLFGLGAQKPYTSPTFVVMKEYERKMTKSKFPMSNKIRNIYHFDAYRVEEADILNLGWEEIVSDPKNICIIEWADKVKKIMPEWAIWIDFSWLDTKRRKLTIGKSTKNPKNLLKLKKRAKNT